MAAMKVLVVDGNQNITEVLSSLLGLFGYVADEAREGREALRKLQLGRFDIVITDSEVNSIDGPEICKFIKSHFQNIYVIGMSGYLSALKDLTNAGADFCLAKPFCLNQLKRAIEHRYSSNPS
jgi:CheY-like chemotaxis protein